MALDLANLIATYNGTAFLAAGSVEWGYIEPKWYLAIPQALDDDPHRPNPNVVETSAYTDAELPNFMKANFHRMVDGGVAVDEALFVTLFRVHIVKRGGICRFVSRGVYEDEYSRANHKGADWNANENSLPQHRDALAMARWVKRFGNAVLHALCYGFISRGHHYKNDMKELYDRLMDAQGVDRQPSFALPPYEVLFRQSVHAFGVKPLVDITLADHNAGRMMAAMSVRFSPHAPVAGSAHISTLNATLEHMKKEPWYGAFQQKYQAPIATISQEVATIAQHPYEYHVASRIVSGQAKRDVSGNAMLAFNALSQLALGYIDYLGRRHTLSGQRAVTSKAGGIGALAETFSKACSKFSAAAIGGNNMAEFLQTL